MSNLIDKWATVLKADGNLKSYEHVVIVEIDGDRVLVEDAAMNEHYTTLDNLRIKE